MKTLQERIAYAYNAENARRRDAGEKRLTKTEIWKAAKMDSSAASHWFAGRNGMDLDTAQLVAPLLHVSARWLFDGNGPAELTLVSSSEAPRNSADKDREYLSQYAVVIGKMWDSLPPEEAEEITSRLMASYMSLPISKEEKTNTILKMVK